VPFDLADSDFGFTEDTPKRQAALSATTGAPAQSSTPVIAGREVEAIVREVQNLKRPTVKMALEDAIEKKYSDGVLTITFAKDDRIAKIVRDNTAMFRTIGEKLFGQPILVELIITGQGAEEVLDEVAIKRQELEERAKQNPAVSRILDEFGGKIISVKEVGETNKAVK